MKTVFKIAVAVAIVTFLGSCGGSGTSPKPAESATKAVADPSDWRNNKGVGPITKVELGTLDAAMAAEGEQIFKTMCSACHKPEEKFIGPAPKGILERRTPEWIMNMILNPEKMVVSDPIAKQLLVEANLAPMANQHLTEEQARKILEYFRTLK
jgi:mono/diheme cytochrome c family protein